MRDMTGSLQRLFDTGKQFGKHEVLFLLKIMLLFFGDTVTMIRKTLAILAMY